MKTVGIIGYGFVGKATSQLAVKDQIKVIPFDLYNDELNSPAQMLSAYSCDFVFVCVPTPTNPDTGHLDVSIVVDSVNKWKELNENTDSIIIIKSTIPVGTINYLCDFFDTDNIVHNPEFLTERTAMQDFMDADEIIVGGPNQDVCQKVLDVYGLWSKATRSIDVETCHNIELMPSLIATDAPTAELVKTVRNSFYALKVAFMNQIYDLCEKMEVDYEKFREVFAKSGKHSWINPMHTFVPGPRGKEYDINGNITNLNNRYFSGKCLPKDSLGLVSLAQEYDVDLSILREAILANNIKYEMYSGTINKQEGSRRPNEDSMSNI